jgi:hypothetical protein
VVVAHCNDKEHRNTTDESRLSGGDAPSSPNIGVSSGSSGSTRWFESKDELSRLHVGRVIGRGGEMIRDLLALVGLGAAASG